MSDIERNKELCERYPFLLPRNVWTDKIDDDYDYSWTLLDNVEEGWKKLFLKMCEEIREPLINCNFLDKFRFSQIKEKWGVLRMYHFGAPAEVNEIIWKYEKMSARICINCGDKATKMSRIWYAPWCDKCARGDAEDYEDINDFYGSDDDGNN